MTPPGRILLLLMLFPGEAGDYRGDRPRICTCWGCGPLSLPLLVGLVAADAVLSLLIVGVVFMCARPRHQPTQEVDKVYINMPVRG
ncbi:hematopoietic cell signal transducer [Elephas maximus indicus]|uniref:hematopoietic cell signal transducer n=1 Tax=Elephas maximus indicus TaxID=99487 RepID=UPI000C812F17|nr:hematopoietic cell signal transducer [Loxodonta africana]XP_049757318.1 hematopoietic cell signal transducer [Elephas maximus indicus]